MKYTPNHAAEALGIVKRLLPSVTPRPEYTELVAILECPHRWKEAHEQFTRIRTHITLPNGDDKKNDLDSCFAYVAENAAKTAYNCSGESAPFDANSFRRMLRCETEFLDRLKRH